MFIWVLERGHVTGAAALIGGIGVVVMLTRMRLFPELPRIGKLVAEKNDIAGRASSAHHEFTHSGKDAAKKLLADHCLLIDLPLQS